MRIAITGIGSVCSIGLNCNEILQSLLHEYSGIRTMRMLDSVHRDLPVGEVQCSNRELRKQLSLSADEPMSRTALLGLMAAREALSQAGLTTAENIAFISGTTVGGMNLTEDCYDLYQQGKCTENILLHEAGETTNAIARHLQKLAFVATPSTACSSALNAIILGANMLLTGKVGKVLAGGCESLSKFHLNGFNSLMILDKKPCRPFDATRAGLNLGEGAGYLLLEPEEDALNRGATILGYIGGYGNACDAFHQTASSENGEGAYLAMRKAVEMAQLLPEHIDYVNAHGTGTPNNDLSESAALKRLFGNSMPPVSSTKSFTGHTTSACGSIEATICVMAVQRGFIPANLRFSNNDEDTITPVEHTIYLPVRTVLCNAFGFGGNDSSIVISATPIDIAQATFKHAHITASVEQTDDLDISSYISPAQARRISKQTRRVVTAAMKVMKQTAITMPDAIVCATQWGSMACTMLFLTQMLRSHEQQLPPTPFIQSTHNTIASLIAILTGNHSYNATYSQGEQSLQNALTDIETQMSLGMINNALLLEFDEQVDTWDEVLKNIARKTHDVARATIFEI